MGDLRLVWDTLLQIGMSQLTKAGGAESYHS